MRRAKHIVNLIEGFKLGSLGVSRKPKVTLGNEQPEPEKDLNQKLKEKLSEPDVDFEAVLELIEQGADPDTRSEFGWPAIVYAAYKNRIMEISRLLKNNADIDIQGPNGVTAIMAAVDQNHLSAVVALARYHANLNIQDSAGITALMRASEYSSEEIVHALLEKGADATLKDHKDRTAFRIAKNDSVRGVFRLHGINS
jgi:ankyrin repeat protein